MYGYIYKTTNLIDNKIYIGQRKSSKFQGQSYLGSGKHLKRAVGKYGKDNFKVELLEEIDCVEKMDEREIYWISFYNSTNLDIGYNISNGGLVNRTLSGKHNGMYGKHHSENTKEKIRQRQIIYQSKYGNQGISKEANQKRSETLMNHSTSEETKQKIKEKNSSHTWVHNCEGNMFIHKKKLNSFLENGFEIGKGEFPKVERKGITTLTDGEELINVNTKCIDVYLHNGYWKCSKRAFNRSKGEV